MNTIKEALEQLKNGGMVVVIDDETRENEGDLVAAAEFADKEMINFMITQAKGLICMPMSLERVEKLGLNPMVSINTDNHQTAFTESIDFVDTTTGISAEERALTAFKASENKVKPKDFRRPGHMFPLVAKPLGLFERRGHTEATVDLLKLANLNDCGLCCEIIGKDGDMLRLPQLLKFAKKWNLPIISVEQILEYKKINEPLIKLNNVINLPTEYGEFKLYSFTTPFNNEPELALVKGNIKEKENVLCRMHSECFTGDVLGSKRCECGPQLHKALEMINAKGEGVLLYLRQEGRGIGLCNKLKAYKLQEQGYDTVEANELLGLPIDSREYFVASQILKYLKVKSIDLLTNNPNKIEQLKKYEINVANRESLEIPFNIYNERYLKTKKTKMGHLLNLNKEGKK